MSEDCHDSNNVGWNPTKEQVAEYKRLNPGCCYCGELGHDTADCPELAAYRQDQATKDMAAEAAYYDIPGAAESF